MSELRDEEVNGILNELKKEKTVFMCIGTDNHVWDSVAPIAGSLLSCEEDIFIFGNLENPITSVNVERIERNIRSHFKEHKLIVIDACVTDDLNNHCVIELLKGGIKPGLGVGKDLKRVGDYSILCNIHRDRMEDTRIRFPFMLAIEISKIIKEIN